MGIAVGVILLATVVAGAPLATGGVHRSTEIAVFVLVLLSLGSVAIAEMRGGVPLRISTAAAAPLMVFLSIPLLQSIPLPSALLDRLDPAAAELIADSGQRIFRALSLDPPSTWLALGQTSAAMATVIIAAHVMSGRSFRYLLLRTVVLAAIAAVVIGVGHRILGEERIYGAFPGSRGILNGPFINPNHTAQFLELGCFAALALAFAKSSIINRVGWTVAGVFLAAGALGTLSRGGVLALAVSSVLFVGLYRRATQQDGEPAPRRPWFVVALLTGLIAVVALSLGASQIVGKFTQASFSQETRFHLWVDSLKLLVAHPLGIGRGAFDRVYPTIRTVEGHTAVRFSFVENEPLQLLIDTGWLGMAAIAGSLFLLVRQVYRQRRGDRVELALVCGLVAVLIHNLVDFGLETLGVLLPFSVLLGAVLGRTKEWNELRMPSWRASTLAAAAGVGLLIGAATLAHPSSANFDARIRSAATIAERNKEVLRAQAAHPFDYYYVLLEASTHPLVRAGDPHSPRLRVLNRALLLCPRCPEVHGEVARALWSLGKRRQALSEWQFAVATRPVLFGPTVEEVWKAGARPEEMAVLGAGDPSVLIQIATLLLRKSDREGARKVLNSIPMGQVASKEVLLLRADLELGDGQVERATRTLDRLDEIAPNEPRAYLLRAELVLKDQGVNAALGVLDKGIAGNPYDVPLQDRRVRLVMSNEKWSRAEAALQGLETALFHIGENTAVVHTSRAQMAAHLGDSKTAVAEYRAAINQGAGDVRLWMDLARYFESLGRYDDAAAMWTEAQHQQPNDGGIAANVTRLKERKAQLEAAARNQLFMGR